MTQSALLSFVLKFDLQAGYQMSEKMKIRNRQKLSSSTNCLNQENIWGSKIKGQQTRMHLEGGKKARRDQDSYGSDPKYKAWPVFPPPSPD